MILWRISNHANLEGLGGLKHPGRWHSAGRPVVYLAEHPALALLEILVHLEIRSVDDLPARFKLLRVEVPGGMQIEKANPSEGWAADLNTTRALGDAFLTSKSTPLLCVPSAVVPGFNYVLNPLHPLAPDLVISDVLRWPLDPRLAVGLSVSGE